MLVWVTLILGIFLYVGVENMLSTVATGTSTAETLAVTIIPLIIALVIVGGLWRLFR